MGKNVLISAISILSIYLIFVIISASFGFFGKSRQSDSPTPTAPSPTPQPISNTPSPKINVLINGNPQEMDLETYLVGVVAAEMPATFELEALKAQAVAARTYTEKKRGFQNADHPTATVCDDPAHCSAYITYDKIKERHDADWLNNLYPKITNAVNTTRGEIITYNNEPISAVFHSTSSGITENARDVWGGDTPYLVSTKSEGEENSPRYTEEVTLTLDEFKSKINSGTKKADFGSSPSSWIGNITKNESGSVNTINIGGVSFKGTDIRSLLGIRSTNFEINIGDKANIKTKGNGHGVGLSQYGANFMAQQGYEYKDILKKYYTGVEVN